MAEKELWITDLQDAQEDIRSVQNLLEDVKEASKLLGLEKLIGDMVWADRILIHAKSKIRKSIAKQLHTAEEK